MVKINCYCRRFPYVAAGRNHIDSELANAAACCIHKIECNHCIWPNDAIVISWQKNCDRHSAASSRFQLFRLESVESRIRIKNRPIASYYVISYLISTKVVLIYLQLSLRSFASEFFENEVHLNFLETQSRPTFCIGILNLQK